MVSFRKLFEMISLSSVFRFQKKIFYFAAISLYAILFLPFIEQIPKITLDENWIGNTAHTFTVETRFGNTVPGWDPLEYFYLLPFFIGTLFKIFGTTVLTARLIMVAIGLIALFGFLLILDHIDLSYRIRFGLTLLFITGQSFYIHFRWLRPEGLVLAFLIWSVAFWLQSRYFWSALCIGLAISTHPIALIWGIPFWAGMVWNLLSFRNQKKEFLFSLLGGILPLILLGLLWTFKGIPTPFLSERSIASQSNPLLFWGYNFIQFIKTYCQGWKRTGLFLVESGILIAGLFFWKTERRIFWFSFLGLFSFLFGIVFVNPFRRRYFVMIVIYSLIVMAFLIKWLNQRQALWKWVCACILIFYGLNNAAGIGYLWAKGRQTTPYSEIREKIIPFIPKGSSILTHLEFWFPFQDYTVITDPKNLLKGSPVDYVVMTDIFSKALSPITEAPSIHEKQVRDTPFDSHIMDLIHQKGHKVFSFATNGYGTIEVWKLSL